jgi:hypothetical protein
MEMQRLIEMLAEMNARLNTNQKEIIAKIDAETEAMRDKRLEANRNTWRKARTADQETMEARLECEEPTSADMKACQVTTEADTEKIEPDSRMMQSVAEHQEVSKEEATVMPVEGLRKRRVRNLAAERRQKPKERKRGYCGFRKRVIVAGSRNVSRRARVAWRKINPSGKLGPRKIVNLTRSWPPPE